MSKKSKLYKISTKDDETSTYGSFSLSDLKRMANALVEDLDREEEKESDSKNKKSLLKRLKKLIDD